MDKNECALTLEEKLAIRKRFHDLNNKLMIINGYLGLVQEGLPKESGITITDCVNKSYIASSAMTKLIDEIREIAYERMKLKLVSD